jgi:Mg2+/Co2+ transporter CorB
MSISDWVALAILLVCLLASFFFSGSETALIASSRATMLHLAREGDPRAGIVARLMQTQERLIGALLVGNNVAAITASAVATSLMMTWFGDAGVFYATAVMTVLIVVFCEVLPKTAAIDQPDRLALLTARPMSLVVRVLGPVLTAIHWTVEHMLGFAGFKFGANEPMLSAHEEAASPSRTATCSAACSICPTSPSPT